MKQQNVLIFFKKQTLNSLLTLAKTCCSSVDFSLHRANHVMSETA